MFIFDLMNENLDPTDSDYSGEELEIDKALRPLSFDDFAGQDKILNNLKIFTPSVEPATPPNSKKKPILKSTFFFLQCAITPDTLEAKTWGASEPTATTGGMPKKIKRGVIKKPPPTPNKPDKAPTSIPIKTIKNMLTFISAIGR